MSFHKKETEKIELVARPVHGSFAKSHARFIRTHISIVYLCFR